MERMRVCTEGKASYSMKYIENTAIFGNNSTLLSSQVVLEYGKLSTPYLQTRGCGSYIAQWAKQPAPNDLQCLAETSPFETGMIVAKASSGKW